MTLTMKGRFFISIIVVMMSMNVFAQDFVEVARYPIQEDEVWLVDGQQNLIVTNGSALSKYAPDGKLIFRQGLKSMGGINKIELVNTLKFYAFSEDQQLIVFYDNSLTPLDKSIDLSDYDIVNAKLVARSAQSDKIWVYDQVNSNLKLISFNGLLQSQQVSNLRGMLNAQSFTKMRENDNRLYLLDEKKGVYVLDQYGSLIRFFKVENASDFLVINKYLVVLLNDELKIYHLESGDYAFSSQLLVGVANELSGDGDFLYFRNKSEIIKGYINFE